MLGQRDLRKDLTQTDVFEALGFDDVQSLDVSGCGVMDKLKNRIFKIAGGQQAPRLIDVVAGCRRDRAIRDQLGFR